MGHLHVFIRHTAPAGLQLQFLAFYLGLGMLILIRWSPKNRQGYAGGPSERSLVNHIVELLLRLFFADAVG